MVASTKSVCDATCGLSANWPSICPLTCLSIPRLVDLQEVLAENCVEGVQARKSLVRRALHEGLLYWNLSRAGNVRVVAAHAALL